LESGIVDLYRKPYLFSAQEGRMGEDNIGIRVSDAVQ
jgi:hypothetical protein